MSPRAPSSSQRASSSRSERTCRGPPTSPVSFLPRACDRRAGRASRKLPPSPRSAPDRVIGKEVRAMLGRSKLVALLAAIVLTGTLARAGKTKAVSEAEPGPAVISEEEKAIVEDSAKGVENAVILLEETVRNEDAATVDWISYHIRIKILS